MNTRNDMLRKTVEYILLGVIGLVIIVTLIYIFFIKQDDVNNNNSFNDSMYTDKVFTKLEKVVLNSENKVIKVNKKKIFVKAVNGYLYIDDKLVDGSIIPKEDDNYYIYYNDYLIFLYKKGPNYDGLIRIVNEEGKDVLTNGELPLAILSFSNNNLLGRSYTINEGYVENKYYSFKYNGKEFSINELYPEITKLEKLNLNDKNKAVDINNKKVNLKIMENALYFNDKKIEEVYTENVYLTDYFILITSNGECDEIINAVIDENGHLIKINNNDYQINGLRVKNKKLVANGDKCACEEENCHANTLREISYNGEIVTIN